MNRRSFLGGWSARLSVPSPQPPLARPAAGSLDPFVPTTDAPWNALRAGHLLRRATFLPTWSEIQTLVALTPAQAVDRLLDTPYEPSPPSVADSITESLSGLEVRLRAQIRGRWQADAAVLRAWQAAVMRDTPLSIAEKMTAFWSNHFATEFRVDDEYVVAPLLYRQNRMFRRDGLGTFPSLMVGVTLDPAMLVYLGGNLNVAGRPNENYAREMLELYTTGLGHYTEGDIKEAARVLTGWKVSQYSDEPNPNGYFAAWFDPASHDINAKQFMGVSFPSRDASTNTDYLVRRDEVTRLVDTVFQQRPQAVAQFICRKLYRFFVYSNPGAADEGVIAAMASLFIDSGFSIRAVMRALLLSEHFYDNANLGAQIKTPAEFEIGLARQLGTTRALADDMTRLGQELFDAPNVAGWPGYHDWITTTTYPFRAEIGQAVVTAMSEAALLAFIRQFPGFETAGSLIDRVGELLLPRPMSAQRKGSLVARLLSGAPEYEWGQILSTSPSTAARGMRDVLTTIVQLPDFQLC